MDCGTPFPRDSLLFSGKSCSHMGSRVVSVKSVINNKTRREPGGAFRTRFDQCSSPGGVLLASWMTAAEIRRQVSAPMPKGRCFRTIGRGTGLLTRTVLPQANAYAMIRRRVTAAGIATKLGNHSFRATGITAYLKNGGTLEKAAAMANHASTRTTQLYDRRRDEVSLDEVERIVI